MEYRRALCSVAVVVVAVMRYHTGSDADNVEVGARVVASARIGIVSMAHISVVGSHVAGYELIIGLFPEGSWVLACGGRGECQRWL